MLFVIVSLYKLVQPEVYVFSWSFAKQRSLLTLAPLAKLVLIVRFPLLFLTEAIDLCVISALIIALLLESTSWLFKFIILSFKRVNEVRRRL